MSTFIRRKPSPTGRVGIRPGGDYRRRLVGGVIGVVTNITDPLGWGRIKVRFPWLHDEIESHWARIAQPYGGAGRGSFWLPEIGDEVVVVFERGDQNHPYMLGGVWNGEDSVPHEGNKKEGNHFKVWRTRNSHQIIFEDTPGNEKITLIDGPGKRSLVIDVPADTITLTADPGDITLETPAEHIYFECVNMEIEVSNNSDWKIDSTLSEHCTDRVEKVGGPDVWKVKTRWNNVTENAKVSATSSQQSYDKLGATVTENLTMQTPGSRKTTSTTIRRRSAPETSTIGQLQMKADNTVAVVTNGPISINLGTQNVTAKDLRVASSKVLTLNGGVMSIDGKGELTALAKLITLC